MPFVHPLKLPQNYVFSRFLEAENWNLKSHRNVGSLAPLIPDSTGPVQELPYVENSKVISRSIACFFWTSAKLLSFPT